MKMYKLSNYSLCLEEKEVEKITDKFIFFKVNSKVNELRREMIISSCGVWYKTKKEAIEKKLNDTKKSLDYQKEKVINLEKDVIKLNEMLKKEDI